jgi:hypothetical protein
MGRPSMFSSDWSGLRIFLDEILNDWRILFVRLGRI